VLSARSSSGRESSSGDGRAFAILIGVAVVAGAVTLGVDALVTPLSGAALFALSGVLTGLGLWVFFPVATPRRQPLRARGGRHLVDFVHGRLDS
jgi:hypothetical protein